MSWYFVNDADKEVDIEYQGLDLTEHEPKKAFVSIKLSFDQVKELYDKIKEEQ